MDTTPPSAQSFSRRDVTLLVLGLLGGILLVFGNHAPLVRIAGVYDVEMKDVSAARAHLLDAIAAATLILSLMRRPTWLLHAGVGILLVFGSMAVGGGEPIEFPGKDWVVKQGLKIVAIKGGTYGLILGIALTFGAGLYSRKKS